MDTQLKVVSDGERIPLDLVVGLPDASGGKALVLFGENHNEDVVARSRLLAVLDDPVEQGNLDWKDQREQEQRLSRRFPTRKVGAIFGLNIREMNSFLLKSRV